ncbi:MAG: Bax inhibitor-1/YccA family protein [Desulfobacteraceae bacterium]|nr:Bax inhibitor-1/YccA family protein [Desulfobacteraceae bacterium]
MNAQSSFGSQASSVTRVNSFLRSVYNWMTIGLALTGLTAFYVSHNPTLLNIIYGNMIIQILLFVGVFGLVFFLSSRIQKLSASTATTLFVVYAVLMGVLLSYVFIAYTASSIVSTFFICALTFGSFSIYGMVTKRDLTSLGSFMFIGLIGIIIASVVNIFIGSSALEMIISYIGVIIFVGLTAYDTQKLKEMSLTMPGNATGAMVRKATIMGALTLYLDFINLFLMLLRILGVSRD